MSRSKVNTAGPASWVELLRWRAAEDPNRCACTFLVDGEESEEHVTYAQLDQRARSIAARLQEFVRPGEHAALMLPTGLEYVAALFGCLYAGAAAVPLAPVRPQRGLERLTAIVEDAQPAVLLTSEAIRMRLDCSVASATAVGRLEFLSTESITPDAAANWKMTTPDRTALALLQYTSGSTARPKGVMVSHGHLLHNAGMIQEAFGQDRETTFVGWLPLFHDMGLIGILLQSLFVGGRCILMSPEAFLMQPFRWLRAVSRYQAHTSGGPNFAYEHCARRITPQQQATLDLSGWQVAFNGAEPIRDTTLERFTEVFGPCGFRREAFYPCYGLAEATLFVSGGERAKPPRVVTVHSQALEEGSVARAEGHPEISRSLVACGHAWGGQRIEIVDPASHQVCPPGRVGEIWVAGPSVAGGYWNRADETQAVFQAFLAESGAEPFLRTGDLGFLLDGQLYITGRLKDLLILQGRNHYAEDIEQTVEQSHAAIRPGCCAAFSINPDGEERPIVVAEIDRGYPWPHEAQAIIAGIRRNVAQHHDLSIEVAPIRHGSIPKTTSGKIQRHACRVAYLRGTLAVLEADLAAVPGRQTTIPGSRKSA